MLTESEQKAGAQYVIDRARHVIETFGPRPPGSEAEAATQHLIKEELTQYCGAAEIEPFPVAPKAFMNVPRVAAALVALGVPAWFLTPWLSLSFSLLGLAVLFFELIRYREFIDIFFRRATSHNVWARHAPTGEAKRRIVLNGHPDAAFEWRYLYHYPKYFNILARVGVIALFIKLGLDLAFAFLQGGWPDGYTGIWFWLGIAQIALLPCAATGFFYTDFRHVSPGAADNLSGTFLATAVAKLLHENGKRPEHTEIEYLITGSEEAGLRGAKAHMARHAEDYRDIETIFIALDTFRELEHFKVYNKDLNGTVTHDPAVCALLKNAAKDVGLEVPYGTVYVGASDAAAFTQAGHKAGALVAMDPAPADYYHNRRDTWEDLDAHCLEKMLAVLSATIERYDRDGLQAP